VAGVITISICLAVFLKKFRRLESKRRYRKRKRGSRSQGSTGNSYERLPMTDNGSLVKYNFKFNA